jgi:hypothetical protein
VTELLAVAEEIARDVGEQLTAPDADWPHAMLVWRKPNNRLGVVELPRSYTDKAGDAAMVANILRGQRATEAVLVCNAYITEVEPGEEPTVPPSLDPNRAETLIFMAVTNSSTTMAMASIARHPDTPPTLGPVELMDRYEEFERRDASAMRLAISDNKADTN